MEGDDATIDMSKLTKGQKKALKEKQKREAAAKAAGGANASEEAKDSTPAPQPAKGAAKGGKPAKGAKGKKGPPAGAGNLIKKKLAEKKEYMEELEREEERQRQLAEEARKKKEDEERKEKEEAERIEKERLDHIRELKRKGLLLSKKEQAKKDALEDARRRLIEQGLVDVSQFEQTDDKSKKKVVYTNKKKKKNKQAKDKANEEGKEGDAQETNGSQVKQEIKDTTQAKPVAAAEGSEETKPEHSVKPGQEEEVVTKNTTKADEAEAQLDDELKVDNWEDFLDDDVAAEQVKLQTDTAPKDSLVEEVTADTIKADVSQDKSEKKDEFEEEEKIDKSKDKAVKPKKEAPAATGAASIFDRGAGRKKQRGGKKKGKQEEEEKLDDGSKFRCPIICVLGHVDTGKTLLLDKIRKTNVQRGEAGGITQQIGATYFPGEALQNNVDKLDDTFDVKEVQIPGLLVIDTPGHESFTNLRSRGSNLCDLAVLVVDIMHGLEKQTLESIDLLRKRKTPFVVALNKIDVVHGWKKEEYRSSKVALDSQKSQVIDEYEMRKNKAFLQFNENGLNICEYWKNDDPSTYISAIPTSAMTGEGIPDILGMIVKYTQKYMKKKITQRNQEFQCTVLEVKKISGVGTTVDVVLVNGKLRVGDTIVLAGFNGPIVTKIRALLTPQPMKEIRVKGEYVHHDVLYGSMGIKIAAPELDYALAGGELFRADDEDQIEELCDDIRENMFNFADKYVNPKEEGVCVQASTLGSLEALLEFLKTSKIPVCNINIGPIYKKDIMKALKAILGAKTKKEYASILAFDVKIDEDAREYAEENGIKIFEADIIYHLFDQFTEYTKKCEDERKGAEGQKAVFPCVLEILQDHIFHNCDPILLGMNVKAGILKVGTPICVPDKGFLKVGVVESIQKAGKEVPKAREIDGGVSVKIKNDKGIMAGKNFTEANQLVSLITRDSIEALKTFFKDEMSTDDWRLIIKLKKIFGIV